MTRIVLAGGGTAGHTSPLIATAQALAELDPDVEITCIGTSKGLETRVIPQAGLKLELIRPVPMPRKPNLDLVKLPWNLRQSVRQARTILSRAKAQALIGFGGYVAIPAYLAARAMKVPVLVHEANLVVGIANKVAARFAAFTGYTFPDTQIRGGKRIGMPMNRSPGSHGPKPGSVSDWTPNAPRCSSAAAPRERGPSTRHSPPRFPPSWTRESRCCTCWVPRTSRTRTS